LHNIVEIHTHNWNAFEHLTAFELRECDREVDVITLRLFFPLLFIVSLQKKKFKLTNDQLKILKVICSVIKPYLHQVLQRVWHQVPVCDQPLFSFP
jgi:hypothetical protein